MINQFIHDLEKRIPKGLTRKEFAKFIYIELGDYFYFDPKYSFGKSRDNKIFYDSIIAHPKYLNKCFENRLIICKSLAYICVYVFEYFGYKITTCIDSDEYHIYNQIEIDNLTYSMDLQLDLIRIKTRQKTKFFCSNFNGAKNYISDDEQYIIDLHINYISSDNNYTDTYIKNTLLASTKLADCYQKVNFIITYLLEDFKINGYIEMSSFHKKMLSKIKCTIYFADCSIRENETTIYILFLSFEYKRNHYIFYFDASKNRYIPISIGELEKAFSYGLRIESGKIYTLNKVLDKRNLYRHSFYLAKNRT